jgi:hypothetical protein
VAEVLEEKDLGVFQKPEKTLSSDHYPEPVEHVHKQVFSRLSKQMRFSDIPFIQ